MGEEVVAGVVIEEETRAEVERDDWAGRESDWEEAACLRGLIAEFASFVVCTGLRPRETSFIGLDLFFPTTSPSVNKGPFLLFFGMIESLHPGPTASSTPIDGSFLFFPASSSTCEL